MKNYYSVFMYTNKQNEKKYIGYSSLSPLSIKMRGEKYFKGNSAMLSDFQTFGIENFSFEVLESELTKEEAQIKKVQYVSKYETSNPDKGYNSYLPSYDTEGKRIKKSYYTHKERTIHYYCVELDQTFESSKLAELATGIDSSSIRKAARGERHSAGKHPETGEKLHWREVAANAR